MNYQQRIEREVCTECGHARKTHESELAFTEDDLEYSRMQGVQDGYLKGYEEAEGISFKQGYEKGFEVAEKISFDEGYEKGHEDGYEKGYQQALDELDPS